jgi:hypothetical protein
MALNACSSESTGSSQQRASTEGSTDAATPTDPNCIPQSVEQTRDAVPKGTCVEGAECQFTTRGGVANCKPGQQSIGGDTEWECTCSTGEWKCNVLKGGFGLEACPSAADAATD